MRCPTLDQLMDYCEGLLSGDNSELITAHLASGCKHCGGNLLWYERIRALATNDTSSEPPSWVLKRAVKLFDEIAARPHAVDRLGRLVASLTFDSLSQPSLAGVRVAESSDRQLLYSAGEYSIDLQLDSSDPLNVDMTGQILRRNESRFESVANLPLTLTSEGAIVHSAVTDTAGGFKINAIERREYELVIETHAAIITIPRLAIPPSFSGR